MSVLRIKCEKFLLLAYCSFLDQEPATSLVQPAWGCIISEPEYRPYSNNGKGSMRAYYMEALRLDLHFSEFNSCFLHQTQLQDQLLHPQAWLAGLNFYSKQTNVMSIIPKDFHFKQLRHINGSYVKRVTFLLGSKP